MAKNRYINTEFWTDEYIETLDTMEKLLYLYCLTNPQTNIAGIYKISLKRIAFDTGIDKELVIKLLKRFEDNKKIMYKDGYIIIKNFVKHQANNAKIQKGIEAELAKLPDEILIAYHSLSKPIDTLSKPMNNINININSNININENENENEKEKSADKSAVISVIDYINNKCNKNYTYNNKAYNRVILARIKDGYTIEQLKKIVDIKLNDEFFKSNNHYYNPETLYRQGNIEKYLNQSIQTQQPKEQSILDNINPDNLKIDSRPIWEQ